MDLWKLALLLPLVPLFLVPFFLVVTAWLDRRRHARRGTRRGRPQAATDAKRTS